MGTSDRSEARRNDGGWLDSWLGLLLGLGEPAARILEDDDVAPCLELDHARRVDRARRGATVPGGCVDRQVVRRFAVVATAERLDLFSGAVAVALWLRLSNLDAYTGSFDEGIRSQQLFLMAAGYVPVITHPERLSWIEHDYEVFRRLAGRGVFMQVTAGAVTGRFGKRPKYWAEKFLGEGMTHLLATDSHHPRRRPPLLAEAREAAAAFVGAEEATHLVETRPRGIVDNLPPRELPPLPQARSMMRPLSGSIISTSSRTTEPGVKNCPAPEPSAIANLPM